MNELVYEGKTKRLYKTDIQGVLEVECLPFITAFDNEKFTVESAVKAKCVNTINAQICGLLKQHLSPMAFIEKVSDTRFHVIECKMIALEVVVRKEVAIGSSYSKRHPELRSLPYRLEKPIVELNLKTSKGVAKGFDGRILLQGLDPEKGEEDPLIINPQDEIWKLYHSKKPAYDPEADLLRRIFSTDILPQPGTMETIRRVSLNAFQVVEESFSEVHHRLVDWKLEFGINSLGILLIADEISPDNIRLLDPDGIDISKECHRQGASLEEVEENYQKIAELVMHFQ